MKHQCNYCLHYFDKNQGVFRFRKEHILFEKRYHLNFFCNECWKGRPHIAFYEPKEVESELKKYIINNLYDDIHKNYYTYACQVDDCNLSFTLEDCFLAAIKRYFDEKNIKELIE